MNEQDQAIVYGCYVFGFLLVLLSNVFGQAMATQPHGPNGWEWNLNDAYRYGEIVRWLGGMTLMLGIGERIARASRQEKPQLQEQQKEQFSKIKPL